MFLLIASLVIPTIASTSLGNSLYVTFAHQKELPITSSAALKDGWQPVGKGECSSMLGIFYAKESSEGSSEKHPLGLYFTASGLVAGVRSTIFGSNDFSNAAQDELIEVGYWKVDVNGTSWHMDVSFRAPADMCDPHADLKSPLGDRVVINQDTIKRSIPLTAKEAEEEKWTVGSCMDSMGLHHFYDLQTAPEMSYKEENLMPLVAMYNPPDETGVLNAFFFATPVAQPGSSYKYLLNGNADWESPALNENNMCQNWCDDNCHWETPSWATMHIYLDSAWSDLKCPGGKGFLGRTCPMSEK